MVCLFITLCLLFFSTIKSSIGSLDELKTGGESTEKGSCLHLMSGPISMSSLRILYYLHLMQPLQILYYEAKSPIYSVDHSKLLIDRSSVQMHTLEVSCLWKEEQFSKLQLAPCKSSQLFSKIG